MRDQDYTKPKTAQRQSVEINPIWRQIRERSVLDFVNRVAEQMTLEGNPARQDKALRAGLYDMVLHDGRAFRWGEFEVHAKMALGEWAKSFRPDERAFEPFTTRAEWDGFCEAMRRLRDTSTPMIDREHLLRIGQDIEARQRLQAEQRGWT